MSVENGKDYLYLIWKDETTRRQFIVGQLSRNGNYEFKYYSPQIKDAMKAGFTPLVSFPDITETYENENLFPTFLSRLPDRKRKDIDKILDKYSLKEYDAYELLKTSGAKLPIDNLYFIDPILNIGKSFERKFYLAGVRYYLGCDGEECNKSVYTKLNEEVTLKMQPENEHDPNAIQVLNNESQLLGYIPRYYSEAYTRLLKEKRKISCYVCEVEKSGHCSECIMLRVKVY